MNVGLRVTYLGKLETGYGERREEKEKAGSLLLSKTGMGCCWCHMGIREVETAAQLGKAIYPAGDSSGGLALCERAQQWFPSPSPLFGHPIPVSQGVG